jgi:hypothetical protein
MTSSALPMGGRVPVGGAAHRAEERPDWAATHAMLRDLRDQSDFKRPYDLLERALVRHDAAAA